MLTTTFTFEELETADQCYWRSINLREASVVNFEAFARSTTQRVFELLGVKLRKETTQGVRLSAKDLANMWRQTVIQSGSALSKVVTDSFVDTAVKVHERMLGITHIRTVVLDLEERYNKSSPLNNLSNMEKYVVKCKTPDLLLWALNATSDVLSNGFMSPADFTLRALAPKGAGSSSKGLLDLFIVKKDFLDWIKAKFIPAHPFHDIVKHEVDGIKTHRLPCPMRWHWHEGRHWLDGAVAGLRAQAV